MRSEIITRHLDVFQNKNSSLRSAHLGRRFIRTKSLIRTSLHHLIWKTSRWGQMCFWVHFGPRVTDEIFLPLLIPIISDIARDPDRPSIINSTLFSWAGVAQNISSSLETTKIASRWSAGLIDHSWYFVLVEVKGVWATLRRFSPKMDPAPKYRILQSSSSRMNTNSLKTE